MADELQVTSSIISNIETGHIFPIIPYQNYLNKKYHLNINWLLCGSEEMIIHPEKDSKTSDAIKSDYITAVVESYEELFTLMRIPVIEQAILGKNMGCLFMEKHFNKENLLNFYNTDRLEMRKFLSLNDYLDIISHRIGCIMIKPDIENLFSGLQNKISLLQHELVVGLGVPESAINFVIKSAEFRVLIYFLIKTGFKCGFFWCLAFKTLNKQLSKEAWEFHNKL